jgi:hypothetical protein
MAVVRAWRCAGFTGVGICWAISRGRARMLAAYAVQEAFDIKIGEALAGFKVRRAPEFDHLVGCYRPSALVSLEHLGRVGNG